MSASLHFNQKITEDFIRINPELAPEIEISEEKTEQSLQAYINLGIATTKLKKILSAATMKKNGSIFIIHKKRLQLLNAHVLQIELGGEARVRQMSRFFRIPNEEKW